MRPIGPMLPRRGPAPGREHRGQRRVGFRAARVNVGDDGLRGKNSGRVARLAPVLRDQLLHRRRPDRLDAQWLEARERPGPDRAVGHPPEGVQVEPDHLRVAGVQAPEQSAPRLPLQPLEDRLAVGVAGEPRAVGALLGLQRARHGHPPFPPAGLVGADREPPLRLPPFLWSLYNIVTKNGGVLSMYELFKRKSLCGKELGK